MLSEITTIIPTRNRVSFLEKTIISILNQSDDYINKIIICDNASEDSTEELVNKFQNKYKNIKYFKHKTNIGLYQNFSFGISKVKTKYFNLISDDDQLARGYLHYCLNIFPGSDPLLNLSSPLLSKQLFFMTLLKTWVV